MYAGVYILREINTSFHVKDVTDRRLIFTELEGCQFQGIGETKINSFLSWRSCIIVDIKINNVLREQNSASWRR